MSRAKGEKGPGRSEVASPTAILREEHRLMDRAMVPFVEIIKKLEAGAGVDRRTVAEMPQACKTYVERWHHAKEDFLLSMLRARGVSSPECPMRTFYEEHARIKPLLSTLQKASHQY